MIKQKSSQFIICLLCLGIGFVFGWLVNRSNSHSGNMLKPLRLEGYKFVNPLLACDTENEAKYGSPELKNVVENKITEKLGLAGQTNVSVYYRKFLSGETITINPDLKFYPASLSKIPVMIAAYKIADADPGFLNKKVLWQDSKDYNTGQAIKPEKFLVHNQNYTIEEAVQIMIKYSDNNAFYLLAQNIDPTIFKQTFTDLKIPIREDQNSSEDYMTSKDFSYFLRILYNGTYLSLQNSERALQLLSQVDFSKGIAAGVDANAMVSHKFGLANNIDKSGANIRELHDCGIVYKPDDPYLLCVMTKGDFSLEVLEDTIKTISKEFNK